MLESNIQLLLKKSRKDSLQQAPPRWELVQTLKARTEKLLSVPICCTSNCARHLTTWEWMERHLLPFRQHLTPSPGLLLTQSTLTASTSGEGKEKNQIPLSRKYYMGSVTHVEMVGRTLKTKVSGSDCVVNRSVYIFKGYVKVYEAKSPGLGWVAG